jgi:hypothetical protein
MKIFFGHEGLTGLLLSKSNYKSINSKRFMAGILLFG